MHFSIWQKPPWVICCLLCKCSNHITFQRNAFKLGFSLLPSIFYREMFFKTHLFGHSRHSLKIMQIYYQYPLYKKVQTKGQKDIHKFSAIPPLKKKVTFQSAYNLNLYKSCLSRTSLMTFAVFNSSHLHLSLLHLLVFVLLLLSWFGAWFLNPFNFSGKQMRLNLPQMLWASQ